MTTVSELMSPLGAVISVTQSLADAAALVSGSEHAVMVIGLSHQPVGLISAEDLARIAARHPAEWRKKRCACVLAENFDFLRPDQPLEDVLERYRTAGAKPMLVLSGDNPVGVLYPDAVYVSCAEQQSPVLGGIGIASEHTTAGAVQDKLKKE